MPFALNAFDSSPRTWEVPMLPTSAVSFAQLPAAGLSTQYAALAPTQGRTIEPSRCATSFPSIGGLI